MSHVDLGFCREGGLRSHVDLGTIGLTGLRSQDDMGQNPRWYISPWCDVNNPSEGLLAEHDARVHIVRLYLIICAHCVLNASENDTEKTRLYIPITELWYSLKPDNWPPDP